MLSEIVDLVEKSKTFEFGEAVQPGIVMTPGRASDACNREVFAKFCNWLDVSAYAEEFSSMVAAPGTKVIRLPGKEFLLDPCESNGALTLVLSPKKLTIHAIDQDLAENSRPLLPKLLIESLSKRTPALLNRCRKIKLVGKKNQKVLLADLWHPNVGLRERRGAVGLLMNNRVPPKTAQERVRKVVGRRWNATDAAWNAEFGKRWQNVGGSGGRNPVWDDTGRVAKPMEPYHATGSGPVPTAPEIAHLEL